MVCPTCRKECHLTFWNKTRLAQPKFRQQNEVLPPLCRPVSNLFSTAKHQINHKKWDKPSQTCRAADGLTIVFLAKFSMEEGIRCPLFVDSGREFGLGWRETRHHVAMTIQCLSFVDPLLLIHSDNEGNTKPHACAMGPVLFPYHPL